MFYGCAAEDNHDLQGESIEDLASQYARIAVGKDKIKRRAEIISEGKFIGWIDETGITTFSSPMAFPDYIKKLKDLALAKARELDVPSEIIGQIRNENLHELYFFSDPRCSKWYAPRGVAYSEMEEHSFDKKSIAKASKAIHSIVEAATVNGKQLAIEGKLCLF